MNKLAELVKSQADTESALLGALICSDLKAADVLSTVEALGNNGWMPPYGTIWDAFRRLVTDEKDADLQAVRNELVRLGQLEQIGGVEKLGNIVETCPGLNVQRWIADLSKIRGRIKAANLTDEVKAKILRGEDIDGHVQDLYLAAAGSEEAKKKASGWREQVRCELTPWSEIVSLVDEPVPYVVWPIVVKGALTQVQGLPKGGKSAFDVLLGVCGATNTWPYPQFLRADGPLKILYIAWEDPAIMMAKRASLYARGLGFEKNFHNDNLTFMFGPALFVDDPTGELSLRQAIDEIKPDIVVIDTLSHIHRAEENSSSEMKLPMMTLDRIAKDKMIGLVYLHHTNKTADDRATQSKGRGSGAIAAAWHILVDWGEREEGSNVNPITIMSKYEHKVIRWNVTYNAVEDENGIVEKVEWIIESRDEVKAEKSSIAQKHDRLIKTANELLVVGDGWFTAYDIAEKCGLGLDSKSIKRHLQKMCEFGWLQYREGKAGVAHQFRAILGSRGNLE